ncbi:MULTISPECIES: DUF1289 domain-containing protein [Vitreoscilla]|uniref:DUF1289 domain-containing protein n=1 Tax=Vitreoscilla stercoraria TaxID=61 RepID=A0ABY4EHE1_VITST|nr:MULTISPECIES: DUF1289 domain-containing protein [Vitreoscilla]QJQ52375.1 DUF1289 domain-containing protein [Vitreoscilla sp. C1]UOO92817.1 DUF1289 domain-containing protein [Vitreoscilla stercoraria]
MEQLEFFKIPNPCISVCESNNRGYCKGCLRSREERQQWFTYNDAEKKEVLRLCIQRRRKIQMVHLSNMQAVDAATIVEPELDFD